MIGGVGVRSGGEAGGVAAGSLGLVEGLVGAEESLASRLAGHPQGRPDADRMADQAGRLQQPPGDRGHLGRFADVDDHGELVPADAVDVVVAAQGGPQGVDQGDQRVVAGLVPVLGR
jgi:hypothetical protein